MKRLIKTSIILTVFLLMPGMALAQRYNINGYDINVNVSQRGKTVEVDGRISGGDLCKMLKIDVFLINEDGNRAHITDMIEDVGGSGSRLFEGKDKLLRHKNDDWEVTSIYTKCISK